ncbi:MAG TPA: hypothetical protein DET40_09545 [Lentisphaeria bacterium]|nr:MAG: hypothetical protein A2X45_08335 [Lentisphaerae bacterium GWF2_50_93]HCE43780.1 hypothetical protein [Lentisphaeria bacterium]
MAENTTVMTNEEKMQKASTTLATMLDYLGLDATVKAEDREGRIALIAVSEDAGRIIGRKGQTLDQLQLLINRMVLKNDTESPRITIDVDGYSRPARGFHRGDRGDRGERGGDRGERPERGERTERPERAERSERPERTERSDRGERTERADRGDRGGDRGERAERPERADRGDRGERRERGGDRPRRDGGDRRRFDDRGDRDRDRAPVAGPVESEAEHEQKIRQQALDAAKEVKRWGDSVVLPPMNSHDRRIVHVTLKEDTEIKSESQEADDSVKLKSVTVSLNKPA